MQRIDPSSDTPFTIKENIGGTYTDLTATYANVVAYLYTAGGALINKWSKTVQSGYDSIYAVDAYTYEFYVYRDLLEDYKNKKIKLEIKYVESVAGRGLDGNLEHSLGQVWFAVEDSNMDTDA